ncbi:unnamed protein product [Adineta steineri]|uniref:G-protein coupled receptors family 1 profile domain-containing protein n=2 Tax=Adineta steineri TaxID=433720 RepID=A0A819PZ23_9BILA|nr:unnamed protein product [Adineta steineri]
MQINRHAVTILIIFGTVGNILNICVLTENTLRKIPCAIYLCWSSVSALVFIWSGLLTRVLQGYNVNWPNQNPYMCKIRLFLLSVSWAMAAWALVGASMDRFLCSNHSAVYRGWSTCRTAKRYLIGILTFFVLLFAQVFYCFEASVPNVPVACYGRDLPCRIFNDWISIAFDIVIPSIFLAVFGTLTIRNARPRVVHPRISSIQVAIASNINNNNNNNTAPSRNNDRNLTRMLLIQVCIVFVLDLPFGVYRAYASLTANVSKSTYRTAIENLTYAVVILLVYFTHSTSFYLYTLTGTLYRATFKRIRDRCFNRGQRMH